MSNEVSRCGDVELWVVAHEEWELPVLAEPYGADGKATHYRMKPPLDTAVTVSMLKALDRRIRQFCVPAESGCVMVNYEDLPKFGRKAPGITPACYVRWPGVTPQIEDQVDGERILPPKPEVDAGRDFCGYLARITGIEYATIRLIWRAIVQYGPKWLIEEKKPINLGFCKLVPCPYRANWKALLSVRFPGAYKSEVQNSQEFNEEMRNTVLAALHRQTHFCYYSLEVVPHEDWREFANAHEGRRVSKLGGGRYAEYWRQSIKKLRPHLLDAFREWATAVRVPCGQLDDGRLFGSRRIVPWVPLGRLTAAAPTVPGAGRVVVDDPNPPLKGPGSTKELRDKDVNLPDLSNILPEPRHVRLLTNEGPVYDVPESKDGTDGTDGVLLLPSSEGPPAGGDLLAEGPGPDGRVAG